jgi:hypothetical protein
MAAIFEVAAVTTLLLKEEGGNRSNVVMLCKISANNTQFEFNTPSAVA